MDLFGKEACFNVNIIVWKNARISSYEVSFKVKIALGCGSSIKVEIVVILEFIRNRLPFLQIYNRVDVVEIQAELIIFG